MISRRRLGKVDPVSPFSLVGHPMLGGLILPVLLGMICVLSEKCVVSLRRGIPSNIVLTATPSSSIDTGRYPPERYTGKARVVSQARLSIYCVPSHGKCSHSRAVHATKWND